MYKLMAIQRTQEIYYEFGPFRLYPLEHVLKCEGREVQLQERWYDILLFLLRCRERIVKSEDLRKVIWGGLKVGKINLYVSINKLRNALKEADPTADEYIKNYPRRGFKFMGTVSEHGMSVTVAVLPFRPEGSQNVSAEIVEGEQKTIDEIGYEMADTLTTKLNKYMSIHVRPSATVNSEYNEHPKLGPLFLGHRLGVDHVFSGRIWRERDRIHVNVDFLDVRAHKIITSAGFDGKYTETFDLDNSIHKWMESGLKLTPTQQETEQATKQYTKNPKAYESYKRGRIQRFHLSESSLRRAIKYFEQAITEDPDFARAYANIADTFIFMGMLNLITPQEGYAGARDAALKAREKDETMASAHTAWAFTTMFFEWQWEESRKGFMRALEINPNYPVAHMGYAHWFTSQGDFKEAIAEINEALKLDPYSFFINFVRGMIFFLARQYDQALEQFQRTQELNLRFNLKSDLSHYGCSLAYEYLALTNKSDEREKLFTKADGEARLATTLANRHPLKLMQRIHVKVMGDRRNEALTMLKEVLEMQQAGHYVSHYHLAMVYASLDEVDLAIQYLEEAEKGKEQYLFLLGVDPRLDSLRQDARFKQLLSRVGLKELKLD